MVNNPPKRKVGSRFRRHPFKSGNMTIALSNYDIVKNSKDVGKWRVTAFYGTGDGFGIKPFREDYYKKLEPIITSQFLDGAKFIEIINNGFSEKIAGKDLLQQMYEKRKSIDGYIEPSKLVEKVAQIIEKFSSNNEMFIQKGNKIFEKEVVPKKQLYALYALNKLISIANNN